MAGEPEIDLVVNIDRPEALIHIASSVSHASAWEREITALEAARLRAQNAERTLVVNTTPAREPPPGIRIVETWRYRLET